MQGKDMKNNQQTENLIEDLFTQARKSPIYWLEKLNIEIQETILKSSSPVVRKTLKKVVKKIEKMQDKVSKL